MASPVHPTNTSNIPDFWPVLFIGLINQSEFITQLSARPGGIPPRGSVLRKYKSTASKAGSVQVAPTHQGTNSGKLQSQHGLGWNGPSNHPVPPAGTTPGRCKFHPAWPILLRMQIKESDMGAGHHQTTCKNSMYQPWEFRKSGWCSPKCQQLLLPELPASASAPRTTLTHKAVLWSPEGSVASPQG